MIVVTRALPTSSVLLPTSIARLRQGNQFRYKGLGFDTMADNILFIHGMWGGGWHRDNYVKFFEEPYVMLLQVIDEPGRLTGYLQFSLLDAM